MKGHPDEHPTRPAGLDARGHPDRPRWVQYTFEWIRGEDPRNPVGTETWSDCGHADLLAGYRTEKQAAAASEQLAGLLAARDYGALDAIEPSLYRDPLEWDGIPYDKEPAIAP